MSDLEEIRLENERRDRLKKKVVDILRSKGIELHVGSCGCCDGVWMVFKADGETIVDTEWQFELDEDNYK